MQTPQIKRTLTVFLNSTLQSVRRNPFLALVCLTFIAVTAVLSCTWFRYQINPDATSYFTIAAKYARFDLHHAINGYWGPMLSWLLVPFIWLHIDPSIGARIVSIASVTGLMLLTYAFLLRHQAGRIIATATSLIIAIMGAVWILAGPVTPDLLIAFLTVLFAFKLQVFISKPTRRTAIQLGIVGAAMYFSKGFGFYLFLAVCAFVIAWQLYQVGWKNYKPILQRWRPALITFIALTLPFICVLTVKYHHVTITNAGAYDHRVFGPVVQGAQPQLTSGPLAPPNTTANTIWEDPTLMTNLMPNWSPLQSRANLHYFAFSVFVRDLKVSMQALYDAGMLVTAGALLAILGCFGKKYRQENAIFVLIGSMEILGYAVIFTDARYLWSMIILALTAAALWIAQLERTRFLSQRQLFLGAVIIIITMFVPVPRQIASAHRGADDSYDQALAIGKLIPSGSKVIADNFAEYYSCYYRDLHCYSVLQTPPAGTAQSYYQQLKRTGITYYIDYHTRDSDPALAAFVQAHFIKVGDARIAQAPTTTTIYKLIR